MVDNIEDTKKKKTLSLKLGSKPVIAPKRNIEAGKTVIVEKKRVKRSAGNESQIQRNYNKNNTPVEKNNNVEKSDEIIEKNKSGVVLKPLSKDEQKRILKADNKKDKNKEIEKIRLRTKPNFKEKENIQNKKIKILNFLYEK